jgi:hypothetical protein
MMIAWTILDGSGHVVAAGRRTVGPLSAASAYHHAAHVCEALERALIDIAPDRRPLPLALLRQEAARVS